MTEKTIKELKMVSNGSTFNAYLMEERPKLRRVRQRVGKILLNYALHTDRFAFFCIIICIAR